MRHSTSIRRIIAASAVATLLTSGTALAEERSRMELPEHFVGLGDLEAFEPRGYIDPDVMGEVELVRERYADGSVKIERQVTLDQDGNYVNHGAWKMFAPNGDVVADGQFQFGERVGLWTRWHGRNDSPIFSEFPLNQFKAPFMSQANFTEGVMDGEWIITDANDQKVCQISLVQGKRHGLAITWLPNGNVFRQATFEQSVPVGELLELDNKSNKLERVATYIDGRRIITKTDHYQGGRQKKSESMYLAATTVEQAADDFWSARFASYTSEGADLRHGTVRAWYANGKPEVEGSFEYDKKSGTFTFWHPNSQIAVTGEYRDDKAIGQWVWWHPNGQKSAVGEYENGELVGQWRWWDENGKLTKQHDYDGAESITSRQKSPESPTHEVSELPDDGHLLRF